MSSIPKGKRKESKLEIVHRLYQIRSKITTELLLSFGLNENHLMKHVNKTTSYIKDEKLREQYREKIFNMEAEFDCWLIEHERSDVLKYIKGILNNVLAANSIYVMNMTEYELRRSYWDKAIVNTILLIQELQYLAEVLPADKNKYTKIVLELDSICSMIKAIRKSDNRLLEKLKEKDNNKK